MELKISFSRSYSNTSLEQRASLEDLNLLGEYIIYPRTLSEF